MTSACCFYQNDTVRRTYNSTTGTRTLLVGSIWIFPHNPTSAVIGKKIQLALAVRWIPGECWKLDYVDSLSFQNSFSGQYSSNKQSLLLDDE